MPRQFKATINNFFGGIATDGNENRLDSNYYSRSTDITDKLINDDGALIDRPIVEYDSDITRIIKDAKAEYEAKDAHVDFELLDDN